MTIEERIKTLENKLFMLNMIDRWTAKDYENNREWTLELIELKKGIK